MTEKLIFQKINNNNIPSHHRISFRFLLNSFKARIKEASSKIGEKSNTSDKQRFVHMILL